MLAPVTAGRWNRRWSDPAGERDGTQAKREAKESGTFVPHRSSNGGSNSGIMGIVITHPSVVSDIRV
ncbi:hypothetical protein KOW79_006974 [Hemibagrus wyckioides]|uniref:Uncharacterized protein n=1 Tax=Hemibagrus wyckioides TaxID=337641 RepID=A0A9D3NX59_9TELE|nr:hypothetical protein KOW79_006974 [Hemibagrus wyckioides]